MSTPRYSVTAQPIETLLAWVKSGEVAIPEIQRPFVWDATQVRNLLDSLYQGYPVGYLIAWRNPTVKLKDGKPAAGKRILIDGQQRVTALMAALLGREVLTKEYAQVRIRIAFHPLEERFEVANPAIRKDVAWMPDISTLFLPDASMLQITREYLAVNPDANENTIYKALERVQKIVNNPVGVIELAENLDIETVTEIFIRVNSAGSALSQADFAMSKIAVNETYGGHDLRKAIDYFCHLAQHPGFYGVLERNDPQFASSDYFAKMAWLRHENDDIYDPAYTDMLRVAFTTEFRRGKLQDLVALLSGRNFETKQFEEAVTEEAFKRLRGSVLRFINETHFKRFVMIVRSAGFVDSSLIGSQNALNFAYILYLTLRDQHLADAEIEQLVRRWFVMSALTGRYSGSAETMIDSDIRQVHAQGIHGFVQAIIESELSDAFWTSGLPQAMDTSVASSTAFRVFRAAQVKLGDKGFLSRDITVRELIEVKSDVHHLFPKAYLKANGLERTGYNQVANYAVTQSEINMAIGKKEPGEYMRDVFAQCQCGPKRYGSISDHGLLLENLRAHCIPEGFEAMTATDYPAFLAARRTLMARKIRAYFEAL
jgi:hypothetical protein